MSTLNIRLIGLAIALPLIAIQIAGAEDIKMTATKKLTEIKQSSNQSIVKATGYFQINKQSIEAQVESLLSIEKKMSDLENDASVPAVRRAAMQKQYLDKKESLVVEVLKSLDDASEEIEQLASGLQDNLSAVGVADSYLERSLAENKKLSELKSNGRNALNERNKLQLEYDSMEITDPKRKEIRQKIRAAKVEINKLVVGVTKSAKVDIYLTKMADFSETYKDQISNNYEKAYTVIERFDLIKATYENELEMINLQREAADLFSMPEGMGDLSNTLKTLESVGTQLSSSELLMPPVPDGSNDFDVPTYGLDDNQLRELFSE